MKYRAFGRTGWDVSEVSFGAWAIGSAWGAVDDSESIAAMHTCIDNGVNLFDTADVYGDGHSEQLIAKILRERKGDKVRVITKAGRRLPKQTVEGYTKENLTAWIERSLTNLGVESLDLVQLHCPPTDLYYHPEVFGYLDDLMADGKIQHYGVSVERVEEALKAIEYPNVKSVQIIFNMFRHRPADLFFEQAKARDVAVIARVPLASGMLTGKMKPDTQFAKDDHRNFNRHGESFDVGETFSGVDYDTGLAAVEAIRELLPKNATMAQFALKWILMFDAVTTVIPGAKRPSQAEDNCAASDLEPLSDAQMHAIANIYNTLIRPQVHQRW
ncbi:MAG: aldo/keto reductase [Chloroflexi bacterium]|nr:aldo/keto reductase [Chloroflexota bacterium]